MTVKKSIFLIFFLFCFIIISIDLFTQDHQSGDTGIPADYSDTITYDQYRCDTGPLPASLNWFVQEKVTPAKDQGNCSCSWAFASAGVFESKLLISGHGYFDLSEQQQLSCNSDMAGSRGGNMHSLRFWETCGPQLESCTGYTATDVLCSPCVSLKYRTMAYYTIDTNSIRDIKTSILNDGPGYFRFDVYDDFFNFWNSGLTGQVYHQRTGVLQGGHAVLIIGWDDARNAWLCKNSWGSAAGPNHDGTFWIACNGHKTNLNFGMANYQKERISFKSANNCPGSGNVPENKDSFKFTGDFNRDGKTDIGFWHGRDGNIWLGLSDGVSITWRLANNCTGFGNVPDNKDCFKFIGDFNGDGKTDIGFWHGRDGNIWLGLSDGARITWGFANNCAGFGNVSYSNDHWKFTGDFNGDGKTDIGFWYGGDGNIWFGLSDGARITWGLANNCAEFGNVPDNKDCFKFIGDFNGDGKTDIGFWHGRDGNIWFGLSGGSKITWGVANNALGYGNVPYSNDHWKFTGDFNGDGKTDIGFWYGINGGICFGLSDGVKILWGLANNCPGYGNVPYSNDHWKFTGDFNGDGKTDIGFWYGVNGGICLGLSDGSKITWGLANNASGFGNVPNNNNCFKFTGNFNGDRRSDIGFWSGKDGNIWFGLTKW